MNDIPRRKMSPLRNSWPPRVAAGMAMYIIVCWMAGEIAQVRRTHSVQTELERLGATNALTRPRGPAWLREQLDIDTKGFAPLAVGDRTWIQRLFRSEAMRRLEIVYWVDLEQTEANDGTLVQLSTLPDIKHLRLRGTLVTDAGIKHLTRLRSLEFLDLENTRVSDGALAHLAGLPRLEYLDLSGTRVTDIGVLRLSDTRSLRGLRLNHCNVSNAGLQGLRQLAELERLQLGNTCITDAGLTCLCGLTHLRELRLSKTALTDAGVVHLEGLGALEELGLDNTGLTDAGLLKLKKCSNLRRLHVKNTFVTHDGATDLQRTLDVVVSGVGISPVQATPAEQRFTAQEPEVEDPFSQ
jgi:hypothetical protein